ncbi:MAG: hypothetical protein V7K46_05685 [Nostoc sp.]
MSWALAKQGMVHWAWGIRDESLILVNESLILVNESLILVNESLILVNEFLNSTPLPPWLLSLS